ncbi:type II toxin-antitoxin system RelB family antitoxin [Pseudomonas asplenii]|uniref:type II toxin-antitoxin system RelB family antitoxin n=1 Tax=Pseudomonas asplenii TaxID=53407 RepID=UPI002234B236|nr:stability determinant [Pseudomonas asplenii]UZE31600.1 stability determinant [Pseudomonas asplenii]
MSAGLSLIVSVLETEEQAASYEAWFRAKVLRSLENPGVGVPHDEVVARMDAIIEEAGREQK